MRRPTNGPMIFFSDPSSELAFAEEVRGAIISGLSFYSYRHPGDLMISFGSSEGFVEGIGTPGFVIGRFDPTLPYLTIPYKGCGKNNLPGQSYQFPHVSTKFDEYKIEIEGIKEILGTIGEGKIVAARVMITDLQFDLGATFFELARRYPDAYVFCFSTPATGCWIGASPELLLQGKNSQLSTMSLAGTRLIGSNDEWDEKNIHEQEIVTEFITETFEKSGLIPKVGETYTKAAGKIEHLCTPISSGTISSDFNLERLLRDLSPTPALCGSPKYIALDAINRFEQFDRGCYGGFCGPFHSTSDFLFNVVLRCGSFTERSIALYAGGGITSMSVVAEEWEETNMKLRTLLSSLKES